MFPSVPPGEYYCKTDHNYFNNIPKHHSQSSYHWATILPTQPKSIIRQFKYGLQPLQMSLTVGKHINWWLHDGMVPSVRVNGNTTIQVFWDVKLHQLVNSGWHFQRSSLSRSINPLKYWYIIIYQSTWCDIPKDLNRKQHHCDNLHLALIESHS